MSHPVPSALVRLSNQKLALMMRDHAGRMQPFFVRGIETGFWDTRNCLGTDFSKVFADYRRLHANTSFFMIHWKDIEPADGRFDFAFTDSIVEKARAQNLKIWWVLFLHVQKDHPPDLRDFWAFKLDSRGGKDYAIQWLKDDKGNIYDSEEKQLALPGRPEINPAYGHPQVLPRILRMLRQLGAHYRNSDTVIGVQIDNEAGFGYFTPVTLMQMESDPNPITREIFENWRVRTGKSDWHVFKLAIVKWWWRQFTTAYHQADPYKLTSFNMLGGHAEAGDEWWIDHEGVDATTYGEGNIDVASPMFYGTATGPKIWRNLDQHYDYVYHLPIFISSEIGLGRGWGPKVQFQQYVIDSLARGAQGYSSYDYRSLMGPDGELSPYGLAYGALASTVAAVEDVLHAGLPGPGTVSITASAAGAAVRQLHRGDGATVGILHFPDAYLREQPDSNTEQTDVAVEVRAQIAGRYTIDTFRAGKLASSKSLRLAASETNRWVMPAVAKTEAVFIRVKR